MSAAPPPPIEIEVLHRMSDVSADDWNSLVNPNDPFTDHSFLALLEESNCVGRQAGWVPVHLLARQGEALVGAAPLYLKNNSYGEYIFDWGWAQAAGQAGIPYYPKLVCAVPFTPSSGHRLLTQDPAVQTALIDGMHGVATATKAHSIHLLFTTQEEHRLLSERAEFVGRVTHQFHWDNDNYESFDHWLSGFRSRRRKEVRRERRAGAQLGVTQRMVRGDELTPAIWQRLHQFYLDTTSRKNAEAYLSPEFFELAPKWLAHSGVAFIAEHQGEIVAGALCFQRGKHLLGRYWGCAPGYGALHFELCYHAPIEAAISNGWSHFEAGAQGMHKLQRGLVPQRTWSAHCIRHPGLHDAVSRATLEEGAHIESEIEWLNERTPFHRETPPAG
jgi:predicted N-acyltransferase